MPLVTTCTGINRVTPRLLPFVGVVLENVGLWSESLYFTFGGSPQNSWLTLGSNLKYVVFQLHQNQA